MKLIVAFGYWPFLVIIGGGLIALFALRDRSRRQLAPIGFWTVLLYLVWWALYSYATSVNVLAWVYAALAVCLIIWRRWLTDKLVALEKRPPQH